MRKFFTGMCPAQQKNYTIAIDYIDTSDLQTRSYEKGRAECGFNKFGDKCNASECPLINAAPQTL